MCYSTMFVKYVKGIGIKMVKYNEKVLKGIYTRIVGSMSGLADIKVEVNPGVAPHFDTKDRCVRMPPSVNFADNEDDDFTFGRGICVHEAGHVLFAPPFNPKTRMDADWYNVIVDCNNEYKVAELWPHLKQPLVKKTEAMFKKKPEMLKCNNPVMQVIMRCDRLVGLKPEFPDNFNPKVKRFVNEVVTEYDKRGIKSAIGDEVVEFVEWVIDKWDKLQKRQGENDAESTKLVDKLSRDLAKMIKGKASDEEIDEQRKKIQDAAEVQPLYTDDVDDNMINKIKGSNQAIDFNNKTLEELREMLKKARADCGKTDSGGGWGCDAVEVGMKIERVKSEGGQRDYDLVPAYETGLKINKALRRKVKLQEDFEKRHRNGRIDLDEIRRQVSAVGRIFKETVFERQNCFTKGGEWAVSVLIDCSNSMYGQKLSNAKQAMATLGYAFDKIPNLKFELVGFSDDGDVFDIAIKPFNKRFNISNVDKLATRGGNADGFNIRNAVNRLIKFRGKKKLMVVISDGQPAYTNGIDDTKQAVQLAKKRNIEVIGIGIEGCCQKSLEEIYPNNFYFEMTNNLHKELTGIILKAIGQKEQVKLVKRAWEK